MKNVLKERGITLIALVITIVILIILATVAINAIFGENGLVKYAEMAKWKAEVSQEKEWISLAINNIIAKLQEVNSSNLEKEIKDISNREVSVNGEDTLTIIYKDSKRKYTVENGKIVENGIKNEEILLSLEKEERLEINETEMILYIDISDFDVFENISYKDFAEEILKEKNEEEKEKIFIEGISYWDILYGDSEKPYTSLEEIFQTYYENGWTDIKYETLKDFYEDRGYSSIDEMLIDSAYVNPEKYNFDTGMAIIDDFELTIINPNGEEIILRNEVIYSYIATENKDYTFTVKFQGKEASITTNINNIVHVDEATKHPDQSEENNTIGIDDKGNTVNMDLWDYVRYEGYYDLTRLEKNMYGNIVVVGDAYKGEYTSDGKIIGEIPAFIKEDGESEYLPVEKMTKTFSGSEGNTKLLISPEIPKTVKVLSGTFYNCTSLIQAPEIPESVNEIDDTFAYCQSLTQAPTIASSVIDMNSTFEGCTSLTQAPEIPSSVTDMTSTFGGCTSLTQAPEIPSSVTNMQSTFEGCTTLTQAPEIPNSVTNMNYTFEKCTSLTQAPVIPSSVTNMSSTFSSCTSLTQAPEIPNGVTSMWKTFYRCTSLTQAPAIPNSVTHMLSTFEGCTSLTQAPVIPNSVTHIQSTFQGCTSLTQVPKIPSSITNMHRTFSGCTSLTQAPEIPSSVTNMYLTFYGCTSLTQAPEIPSSVTNMYETFYGCTRLTGELIINANPTSFDMCLLKAATDPNANLVLKGTSNKLGEILKTKSDNSNITM